MENQIKSMKIRSQRKFYLALPVLAMPFITLIFWAFGGGKTMESTAQENLDTGLLLNLPEPGLREDKAFNKLDFYNQAQSDSIKFKELIRNDPNYRSLSLKTRSDASGDTGLNTSLNGTRQNIDSNEERIYRKLAQLDRELNSPPQPPLPESYESSLRNSVRNRSVETQDIDRLEQMMNAMSQPMAEDEEVKQLNKMLETILDIQHPERLEQRLKEDKILQDERVYPVLARSDNLPVALSDTGIEDAQFYGIDSHETAGNQTNTIEAVFHEDQTLVNGSTVKLRLLTDVVINNIIIPKDNFVFGLAQLNGERLSIRITNIRSDQIILPVELSVYDLDGLKGVYVPGAITRESAKESAERSLQTIGFSSFDPSLGAQAASAGIEAAKSLLSKKVKLLKVTVKAGCRVLLCDEKQKLS